MISVIYQVPVWVLKYRRQWLCLLDTLAWGVALSLATATRYGFINNSPSWLNLVSLIAAAGLLNGSISYGLGLYNGKARIGSIDEAQAVVVAWLLTTAPVTLLNILVLGRPAPLLALTTALPFVMVMMLGIRFGWRFLTDRARRPEPNANQARVLVFGAGEGGEQIIRAMQRNPNSAYFPVGILDDDPQKANRKVMGVPVLGNRNSLADAKRLTQADLFLIALPSAGANLVAELNEVGNNAEIEVRILPSTTELMGMIQLTDIRELTEADLLGRQEVEVDIESIKRYVETKTVLVTGAGGSIGSELCRQLSSLEPGKLLMLDRDESALHSLQLSIEGKALLDTPNLIVADIRDTERMDEIFSIHKPEVVFHTAALKHLTLLENHPEEGFKTNVVGTANLLDSARRFACERFVNVSTDKAADPTSVLGRTKLKAEHLTARAAQDTGKPFVSVRFGNVLGSRGSVLPTFRRQIEAGGPVTVTDPDVTRFFMTIPEAVRLVLQAGAIGKPGEIMILDMGEPVKIVDLAKRLIANIDPAVEIEFTGLRPGEKQHEVLIADHEVGTNHEHPRILHTAGESASDQDLLDLQLATTARFLRAKSLAANTSKQ